MNEEVSYLQFIYMLSDESRRNAFYDHEVQFKKYYIYFPFYKIDISKENFAKSIGYIVGLTQCDVDKAEKLRENQLESKTWLNFGDTLAEVKKGLLRLHLSYMGIDNLDKLDGEENSFLHYLIRQPVDMSDVLTKVLPDILQIIEAKETTTSDLNDMYSNENIYGETPIFAAVLSGEQSNVEQCLSKLREQDETFNITTLKTKNNDNLLHYAILSGNQEVVKYIKRQSDYNVWYDETNDDGLSSTDYYFFINNKIANGKLQEYSADPINYSSGKLFVSKVAHRLAQLKSPALLRWFVEKHKININDCNHYDANDIDGGDTLLHTAALYGSLQTVQYLVYHGADINKHNGKSGILYSENIFYSTVYENNVTVQKRSFKALEMPLHFAALSGCTEKIMFLLNNEAKTDSNGLGEDYGAYAIFGKVEDDIQQLVEKTTPLVKMTKTIIYRMYQVNNKTLYDCYIRLCKEIHDILSNNNDNKYLEAIKLAISWKTSLPLLALNSYLTKRKDRLSIRYLIDSKKINILDIFNHDYNNAIEKTVKQSVNVNAFNYLFSLIGFDCLSDEIIDQVHKRLDLGDDDLAKEIFEKYKKEKKYL